MREQAKFWQAPEFQQLELLRATYVTHTFARHIHETYVVGMVEDGLESFYCRGENHTAGKNQIVLINPGEIHTGQAAQRGGWWKQRAFYPPASLMEQIASEISGKREAAPFFTQPVVYDPETADLIRRAHIAQECSASPLERSSMVRLALAQVVARYAHHRPQSAKLHDEQRSIRLAREYLETHFQEHISLENLAEVAGLSPFHLARVFQKQVGLPPHAYLTHLRVQYARRLLPGGLPLVEVALAAGFADQSHFTRWFKRVVGVTPGQYIAHL